MPPIEVAEDLRHRTRKWIIAGAAHPLNEEAVATKQLREGFRRHHLRVECAFGRQPWPLLECRRPIRIQGVMADRKQTAHIGPCVGLVADQERSNVVQARQILR